MSHMNEAMLLEQNMKRLSLSHAEMATLLGVSARSLFRWRREENVADPLVVRTLREIEGLLDDAEARGPGDLAWVLDLIRRNAAGGAVAALRAVVNATPRHFVQSGAAA